MTYNMSSGTLNPTIPYFNFVHLFALLFSTPIMLFALAGIFSDYNCLKCELQIEMMSSFSKVVSVFLLEHS